MKRSSLSLQRYLLSGALMGIVLFFATFASAEPILRIAAYTVADPGKQAQAFQLVDEVNKVFSAAKGFQWFKAGYDPATGQHAGVSLWDSQADMEMVAKSDALKALVEKLKPLTKGDFAAKIYKVYELKK